ncbi:MAG: AI-2E family transporter [Rhodospirillaceae bacterium]|nr:AI-2E family transporter [Rhodospirillaceae bacterium]
MIDRIEPTPPQKSAEARIVDIAIRLGLLALFVYWSLTLIAPFIGVVIWAIILTVALYPVYAWLRARLGGRGWLAATLITLVTLALVLGPIGALVVSFAESIQTFLAGLESGTIRVPTPSDSVAGWPLIGEPLHRIWTLASSNLETALKTYGPKLLPVGNIAIDTIAGLGIGVLLFAASVVMAGFLYGSGPRFAENARRFGRRIAADRGAHFVDLAGATIRNISRGVIGVAVLQAIYAGIVLALFGVPAAGVIAFALLLLCIVQIGPLLIMAPAIVWAWMTMDTGMAAGFNVALLPLLVIDNLLKPILMARGLETPMLVIIIGVIGGTITYGLIGLFLGPVILSILYELAMAWIRTPTDQPDTTEPL